MEEDMLAATELDLGDGFSFVVIRADDVSDDVLTVRYSVRAELGGRRFEDVAVDVGLSEPFRVEPEIVSGVDMLAFAGIAPILIPTLPLADQVAQKVHAYTGTYRGGHGSSRVKDLVDLVLVAECAPFDAASLRGALVGTFERRGTHPLPPGFPSPPSSWAVAYRKVALTVKIDPDLASGHASAAAFLHPVLVNSLGSGETWDAVARRWSG